MARENVTHRVVSGPVRESTYKLVIASMEEREEQLLALAICLENELKPTGEDGDKLTAYRLVQIMYGMLETNSMVNFSKELLWGGRVDSTIPA